MLVIIPPYNTTVSNRIGQDNDLNRCLSWCIQTDQSIDHSLLRVQHTLFDVGKLNKYVRIKLDNTSQ